MTESSRLARIAAGIAGFVFTIALLVGVPIVLWRLAGWPLPEMHPLDGSWWSGIIDAARQAAANQNIPDRFLMSVLAIVGWVAWAHVAYLIVVETASNMRGTLSRQVRSFGGLQALIGRAVASWAVVIVLALPHRAGAASAPPSVAVGPVAMAVADATPAPVAPKGPVVVAQAGDSWMSIAERCCGDASQWRAVQALNIGTRMPTGTVIGEQTTWLEGGWSIQLPAGANQIDGSATVAPTPPEPASTLPPGAPAHTVGLGVDVATDDNLWGIASERLTDAWGRVPSNEEVLPYWQQIVDAARPQLAPPGNPSLIFPGEHFELPAPPTDPLAPLPPATPQAAPDTVATPPAEAPAPPPADAPTPTPHETPQEAPAPPAEAPPPTTTPTVTSETPTTAASPVSTPSPSPAHTDENASEADTTEVWPALIPAVAGITGFTVLASGVLMALRRARRRRDTISARLPRPDEWQRSPLEKAIIAAADVPLVRWAGQELAELFTRIPPASLSSAPVALELSEDRGIELLWDRPASGAPSPWEATDGGWAWRLLYDEDAPVPTPELPSPIAGLVTLGERDGRQLLFDLESCGSLAITGDPTNAEAVVRSIVLELGSGDELADAYVTTVGIDVDGVEQFRRVSTATTREAIGHLAGTARQIDDSLTQAGAATTFAHRLGPDVAPIEVLVAAVRSDDHNELQELTATAVARRGVAAIMLGDVAGAGARLEVRADGTARLEPLGIELRAVGVARELASQLAVLLDQAEQPVIDPTVTVTEQMALLDSTDFVGSHTPPEVPGLVDVVDEDHDDEEGVRLLVDPDAVIDLEVGPAYDDTPLVEEPRLLVRVLGVPSVPERPALSRREVSLAALLACMGKPVDRDTIQEAVWQGKAVGLKTVYNVISDLRKHLGGFDDGSAPILSRLDGGVLRIDEGVGTDWAMFRRLFAMADGESSGRATVALREALSLVEGPPFSGEYFEWAASKQLVADAEALIERAAKQLVDLSIEAGDLDGARWAVQQGLRALPGNEPLYRSRMRVEGEAGNPAAVRTAYQELVSLLDDLDTEPSDATSELYGQLVPASRRRP